MRKKISQKEGIFRNSCVFLCLLRDSDSQIFLRATLFPFRLDMKRFALARTHTHSSWKLLTNSWVSTARKRNENNRKHASVLRKIVAIVVRLVRRPTICFANIHTNEIYVKLILDWLWNAHSSWPDIHFAVPFVNIHIVLCMDEWTEREYVGSLGAISRFQQTHRRHGRCQPIEIWVWNHYDKECWMLTRNCSCQLL